MKRETLDSLITRALDRADGLLVSKIGRDKVALFDTYDDCTIVVSDDYARVLLSRFLESEDYAALRRAMNEHAQVFGEFDDHGVEWRF